MFAVLGWYAVNSLQNLPHHVSYFNEFVGGIENAAKLTSDSYLDWGQDNKRLADWVRINRIGSIKVAMHFINPPELTQQRVNWQLMGEGDYEHPAPGYYALDVEQLQLQKTRPQSWFSKATPIARVGKTIYLFKAEL